MSDHDFSKYRQLLAGDLVLLGATADPSDVNELFIELVARYTKPNRHYQGVDHLFHVVDDVTLLGSFVTSDGSVLDEAELALCRLAGWFHDAIYEPLGPSPEHGEHDQLSNEEESSALAQGWLLRLGLNDADAITVAELVRSTAYLGEDSQSDSIDNMTAVLHDADLAILAADPDVYDRYTVSVRHEYEMVSIPDWRLGRSRVLEVFLGAPVLFHTPGTAGWNERAAANLRRELATLR